MDCAFTYRDHGLLRAVSRAFDAKKTREEEPVRDFIENNAKTQLPSHKGENTTNESMKDLLELFKDENCNYSKCRELIEEIGGCTQIVEGEFGLKTTPLHEAIDYGHYSFALELIEACKADFNVHLNDREALIWELQYLDSETEELQWTESENKLRLIRALIKAGANPNPTEGGEELIWWIRHKLNEGEGNEPQRYHTWQMEHMIEAHALGATERFFEKIKQQSIGCIMVSDWGFWLMDDDLCDCDHAIFVFEDGERMALSSYQIGDDEWDFYAVSLKDDLTLDRGKHHIISPSEDSIQFLSLYSMEEVPSSHWFDLSIDDAILRIHADDPDIRIGIASRDFNDYKKRKRNKLFLDQE